MSVWNTGPSNSHDRLSTASVVAVAIMVVSLFVLRAPPAAVRTATQLDAIVTTSPTPIMEQTFSQARPIEWDGYIRRIFVSGEGLEIVSPAAPGGIFQAYFPDGTVSPVSSGSVLVHGSWTGYTCAYGGHNGSCVPEVEVQSIERQPVDLQ